MTPADLSSPAAEVDLDLSAAIEQANLPALLMTLVQLTGDFSWLEEPFRPTKPLGIDDNDSGGLSDVNQALVRRAAETAIRRWFETGEVSIPEPDAETFVSMLSVATGEAIPAEYGPMMVESYQVAGLAPDSTFGEGLHAMAKDLRVIIIGAGISGLTAAMMMERLGVDYQVFEREESPGGTWQQAKYPGAGVDTPSHLYSWPGEHYPWSRYFALTDEIEAYVGEVTRRRGLEKRISYGTLVSSAAYDEASHTWTVTTRDSHGERSTTADVLISAVGLFSKVKRPNIKGVGTTTIPTPHAASWPVGLELAGEDVGILGTGATAMQLGPAIAGQVRTLRIFQRSPQWVAPFGKFAQTVPDDVRDLLTVMPLFAWWYRTFLHWNFNDKLLPSLQKDPTWEHPERSLNRRNDRHRQFLTEHARDQLGDRQDLVDKVIPNYPPYGKRILLDNGWFGMLRRDNVELVTSPVTEIDGDTVITADGRRHKLSVLVFATGYDVVNFLTTLELYGRGGQALRERWGTEDAQAYLGMLVPGMPNFFCLYGPNLQAGHGGSYFWTAEAQVRFLVRVIKATLGKGYSSFEVRESVCDDYNARVAEAHSRMVWTHPGMATYYRNSKGRVVANFPWRNIDFWEMTREVDTGEFILTPGADRPEAAEEP